MKIKAMNRKELFYALSYYLDLPNLENVVIGNIGNKLCGHTLAVLKTEIPFNLTFSNGLVKRIRYAIKSNKYMIDYLEGTDRAILYIALPGAEIKPFKEEYIMTLANGSVFDCEECVVYGSLEDMEYIRNKRRA